MCTAVTITRPDESRLVSRFGMRMGVSSGRRRLHAGLDIGSGRAGADVLAPIVGRIARIAREHDGRNSPLGGYGNAVVLEHAREGVWTLYAHLRELAIDESDLDLAVAPGTLLGTIGRTTNGRFPRMVPHLHFEVRTRAFPGPYGRDNIDPMPWLAERGLAVTPDGWTADGTRDACPSYGPRRVLERLGPDPRIGDPTSPQRRRLLWRRMSGLTGLGAFENAEYEPPVPDPDFFKGLPLWARLLGWFGAGTVGLAGIKVTIDSMGRR